MNKEYDFSQGRRGALDPTPLGKTRITIRLDNDVVQWFRNRVHAAGGGNYQTLINQALREHVKQHKEPQGDESPCYITANVIKLRSPTTHLVHN